MLDIDEAGLETWWGDPDLCTAEYPENGTPYGGLLRSVDPPVPVPIHLVFADPVHFTGKPRDIESGLDFFGDRYYSNPLCRWVSADQPFADNVLEGPQSWNLHSYVRNNPIVNYDPDGRALDTIVDVAFIVYDIGDIVVTAAGGGSVTGTQWAALGADAVGALVPFATGGGIAVRAAAKADDVVDAVRIVNTAAEGERVLDKALDAENAANKLTDIGRVGRDGETAATQTGRKAYADFAEKVKQKPGWQSNPTVKGPDGKNLKPGATSPSGRPVELKPKTQSGIARGKRQLKKYEDATGKKGRVVYYDPKKVRPKG